MTRRFRLGLFVCLAGAVGLHVRPCVFTLVMGGPTEACVDQGAPRASLAAAEPEEAQAVRPGPERPGLDAMLAPPTVVGLRTARAKRDE
ncbi:MAG: hypothetical protein AAF957_04530 [Planctomycetota bacterium]